MPHDFRHEPFSNMSTAILKTERHVIPATSPYIVILGEIPQKNSPSTMAVKEITGLTGSGVTYGISFSEVAATPTAGQVWADYNTGAADDSAWNTGKLLFNATDAGKIVEVSYTAIGTLAGVTSDIFPSWWIDRGDGSDGDFVPSGNVTISGVKNYRSVYIPSGVTVTINNFAYIKCQGAFVNRGTITGVGTGLIGGTDTIAGNNGYGGSNGGSGGTAVSLPAGAGGVSRDITRLNVYNTSASDLLGINIITQASSGGGGAHQSTAIGGTGGAGSAYLRVVCREFLNSSTITCAGAAGGNGLGNYAAGGGGGGGGVML